MSNVALDDGIIKINFCAFSERFMDVRTRLPYEFIAKMHDIDLVYSKNEIRIGNLTGFKGPKIIIAQRPRIDESQKWLKALSKLRKNDCLFIYEIDDHLDLVDKINKKDVGTKILLKSAMAVQTSTKPLADEFSLYNENVRWFDNSCHNISFFRKDNDVPQIFFGALNRDAYSKEIASLISDVVIKYGAFVHVVSDRNFYDGIKSQNKTYYHHLNYEDYINVMRKCDILISPLRGLLGERFKSDIKYIEASSHGLATIASELVYSRTIKDGKTGVLVKDEIEWPEKLESLLVSPEYRRRLGYNAWDYVRRERMFAQQAPLRINWYLDLWSRRNELWDMVLNRVPELREFENTR